MEHFINHVHKESGGVVGIYSAESQAVQQTHIGMYALQHRGERAAQIVTPVDRELLLMGGDGFVRTAFADDKIDSVDSQVALGYTSFKSSKRGPLQPFISQTGRFAVAFDGVLAAHFQNGRLKIHNDIPHGMELANAIEYFVARGAGLADAVNESTQSSSGLYSAVVLDRDTKKLAGFTDKQGGKPLTVGEMASGFVIASEDCVWNPLEAKTVHEIQSGEIVTIDENGFQLAKKTESNGRKFDPLELIYRMNIASHHQGRSMFELRERLGQESAAKYPLDIEKVISIPDNAHTIGMAYADQLREFGTKAEWVPAVVANRYLHRTNVSPNIMSGAERHDVRYNIMPGMTQGRIALIEDYLAAGRTTIRILAKVNEVNQTSSLHIVVGAPEYVTASPTDPRIKTSSELLSRNLNPDVLAKYLGINSINFLNIDSFLSATQFTAMDLDLSCFIR